MPEIRACGRLFELDGDGALINGASLDTLPSELEPAVDACIRVYKEVLGDRLHSVYLRGSAVRGTFVRDVSDLDTWAVTHDALEEEGRVVSPPYAEAREQLNARYGFIQGVEICHSPLPRLLSDEGHFGRMLLATQAVPVWGEDVRPRFGRFWPGRDTLGHALHIKTSVAEFRENPPEDVAHACSWVCKALVRAGLEVHAHEHRQYTRDLWPCWALFSVFHPEASARMYEALSFAVNPTEDAAVFQRMLEAFEDELVPLVHGTRQAAAPLTQGR